MPYGGNILPRTIDCTELILKMLETDTLTWAHTHTQKFLMCWQDYSIEKCLLWFLPPLATIHRSIPNNGTAHLEQSSPPNSHRSNSGCVFGLHASCLSIVCVWISVTCVNIFVCVIVRVYGYLCCVHVRVCVWERKLSPCVHVSVCVYMCVCWPGSHCRLLIKFW